MPTPFAEDGKSESAYERHEANVKPARHALAPPFDTRCPVAPPCCLPPALASAHCMCLGFMRFAVLVAFLCGVLALQNTTRHVVLKPGKPALFHKNGNASHAHAHHPPHAGEAPLERHRPPHDAKAGGAPHHAPHAARAVVENVSLHEGAEWRLPPGGT